MYLLFKVSRGYFKVNPVTTAQSTDTGLHAGLHVFGCAVLH